MVVSIKFKIDTGANCNVISSNTMQQMSQKPSIQPCNARLTAYNGGKIPVVGKCLLQITKDSKEYKLPFIITNAPFIPILGVQSCKILNLVKRIDKITHDPPDSSKNMIPVLGRLVAFQSYITLP